ncbi:MAG: dTDP-4-dehydrorhamnose 3,5-epimerase [Verrucomicrobia bacterium]|nr:dTDP-4-dehydrorhamnose 3,5-epimerase [Verrucomicrobiota bacterium]
MKFTPTKLAGVWLVDQERRGDERGWFARTWCAEEFIKHGLNPKLSQCSASFNQRRGTLRGMHYQVAPLEEAKLVRCVRGAVFDVALDLRPASPTFRQWASADLTPDNGRALYVPEGCAHGFQTLADDTEILYQISAPWQSASARGVRWNDPAFGIAWPLAGEALLNDRDRDLPDFPGQP